MASLEGPARVLKFESKKTETLPPKLFKLATAQIAAGKLGYNSARTLEIIQELYEKGYVSYPRTDCEYISSNENLYALLSSALSVPELEEHIKTITNGAIKKVRNTKKWVNDKQLQEAGHSALIPTTYKPDFASLTKEQQENPEVDRVLNTFALFLGNNVDTIQKFQNAVSFSTILFWAMASLVGTVQGGIQAVSRSYFGKLIPKERSNEFFGFFDIFGKFASVLGPVLYSTIGAWTGRSSYGVLALICLFLIGLVIMIKGKKDFEALDKTA